MNSKFIRNALAFLALAWSVPVAAQVPGSPAVGLAAQTDTGTRPYVAYDGTQENINLTNGNVNLKIPLLYLPGRNGFDLDLHLEYDSKIWKLEGSYDPEADLVMGAWREDVRWPYVAMGWHLSVPMINFTSSLLYNGTYQYGCTGTTTVILSNGARYNFSNNPNCGAPYQINVMDTEDNSGAQLTMTPSGGAILALRNGTKVYFGTPSGITGIASKMVDANGNVITFNSSGNTLYSITDSVGRTVTFSPFDWNHGWTRITSITCTDPNAPGGTFTISFGYTQVPLNWRFYWPVTSWKSQPPVRIMGSTGSASPAMLTSLNIGGHQFTFSYSPGGTYNNGELTRIDYPTGGYTTYSYQIKMHDELFIPGIAYTLSSDFREVYQKTSCPSSTTCGTTTYTPDRIGTSNEQMDVVFPDGHKESHFFTAESIPGDNFESGHGLANHEIQVVTKSPSGTILKTVNTTYSGNYTWDLPVTIQTILDANGPTKQETFQYDTFSATYLPWPDPPAPVQPTPITVSRKIDNVTNHVEYDFGSSTVLRRTANTWLKTNNGQDYFSAAIRILSLKASEAVYDGSGNLKAQSQFEYDSYTEGIAPSGAVEHESTFGTGYTTRGNFTAAKRWRNTDGAWLITRYQYDDAGNIRKITDPLQHSSTFSYADAWGNAACAPTGGNAAAYVTSATNALGQVTTGTYNSCIGTVASTTDPNNLTTTFTYDGRGRVIQTNFPDGGQVTQTYNETSVPFSRTSTTKITTAMNLISTVTMDGFGRVVLSSLDSDPQGPTRTKTEYDALDRKKRVYNPTRCNPPETNCGENTWGYTDFEYDGLSRPTRVIPPDGTTSVNNITTSYSGNTVTVTDQAGKQRRSHTDALGRLIQVDEPNPTLSTPAATTYTYDALDNLTQVLQSGSRQRSFTYNSLSQLTQASNPESGTINYAYDNDGNLSTKTDARSITTTHSYDALHRLTQKTYSDGTRTVGLFYDLSIVDGIQIQYPIGRLVKETDYVNVARYLSYDPMGRLKKQWVALPSGSFPYTETDYDLAGNPTYLTYPSGRKVTYGYNGAAQLTRVTFDSWNGQAVNYDYLNNATYAPQGAPTSFPLGNGITEASSYNNRLQPAQLSAASTVLTAFNFSYNFIDGSGHNNGNVMAINDQLNTGRTQTFTYDELNRIKTAQSAATAGADCWGIQFGYDVWANLLSASTTKCSPPNLGLTINTQNRIADLGYQYDAAGNLTTEPGRSYQYDAENRMKSLNTTGATYTYDANGNRVRKQVGSEVTEYIYFGGQVIAERNTAGDWSDYIYAGSRRVAKADNFEYRIRTWGNRCGSCGPQWDYFQIPASFNTGIVIQGGDKLLMRQWQTSGTRAGILVWFTDGTHAGSTTDQDGWPMHIDGATGFWHYRRFDLSAYAGKMLSYIEFTTGSETTVLSWESYYQDVALVLANGTVKPLYNREKSVTLYAGSIGGGTNAYQVNYTLWYGAMETTQYYHGDHLGSSRMMSTTTGYPVWQATYLPFGQEWNPQATVNHYKFTGKERDTESGLDFFIARYYSSQYGRFLSPDEFTGGPVDAFSSGDPLPSGPLPYADITNPQSLNKYTYVYNNPLSHVDPDGHEECFANGACNALRNPLPNTTSWAGVLVNAAANTVSDLLSLNEVAKGSVDVVNAETTQGKIGVAAGLGLLVALNVATGGEGGVEARGASLLEKNVAKGAAAEAKAAKELVQEGRTVLGSQVGVQTSKGLRVTDHLTEAAGQLKGVEVKAGKGTRNAAQRAKDAEIASQGGKVVGKNAPAALRGRRVRFPTEVRRYPD